MDIVRAIFDANPKRSLKNLVLRGLKAQEECGELAQAILTSRHRKNPKGLTHDDVRQEAVDVAIMGIDIACTPGPGENWADAVSKTYKLVAEKLEKWKSQQLMGTDLTAEED